MPLENQNNMMHPELMHIVIKSHHDYLRSLAKGESFADDVRHGYRSLRNAIGRGMVRTGRWLEGHASPVITPNAPVRVQESQP